MAAFQHRDRIEYCYSETIQEPFDDVTNWMLENTALSNSVPNNFVIIITLIEMWPNSFYINFNTYI